MYVTLTVNYRGYGPVPLGGLVNGILAPTS